MSVSSKTNDYDDGSRIELPVFVSPVFLSFALNKRKSYVTIFNPYENDAQFKILTTSPQRFDVNITKGTIKPQRCIDISIRLLPDQIEELPEPDTEPQTIDSFRVSLQVGNLRGNRAIQVLWSADSELENNDSKCLTDNSDKLASSATSTSGVYRTTSKSGLGARTPNSPIRINRNAQTGPGQASRPVSNNRARDNSNVNLICTVCAVLCVLVLFMPLSIDNGLCNRAIKTSTESEDSTMSSSWISMAQRILGVSYEMKVGCSFALGLFTYRLISTLPD